MQPLMLDERLPKEAILQCLKRLSPKMNRRKIPLLIMFSSPFVSQALTEATSWARSESDSLAASRERRTNTARSYCDNIGAMRPANFLISSEWLEVAVARARK